MPLFPIVRPWTEQPQGVVPLAGDGLLQGIDPARTAIWTPHHGPGGGAYTHAGSSVGLAADLNGTSQYATATASGDVSFAAGVTMFVLLRADTATSEGVVRQAITRSTSAGRSALNFSWAHANASFAKAWATNDGATWTPLAYSSLAQSTWLLLSASVASGSGRVRIYENGVLRNSTTVGGVASGLTSKLFIGCASSDGVNPSSFFDGQIAYAGEVGRSWSDTEHAAFAERMWQLFEPLRICLPVSAGGGGYTLTAAAATFATTGPAAGLTVARSITADQQSYTLTGLDATLNFGKTLTADAATFALTGNDAGLTTARLLTADQQAYMLTGVDAGLTYTPQGPLVAEVGAFSFTGNSANLTYSGEQTATQGAGRPRRVRRRIEVEIDGNTYDVASPEEAQQVLERVAKERAELAIERAAKAARRPTRKVLRDAQKTLTPPKVKAPAELSGAVDSALESVRAVYAQAYRDIQISALMRDRERALEEDDEEVLMLL